MHESFVIMLNTREEEAEIAEEMLVSIYNSYDWKLDPCKDIQRVASLCMLPMMQASYFRSMKFFRLTRYALSGEIVAKLPIHGEWKGGPASGVLLFGRRGQLFNFNPYKRIGGGGNYNICMMAPSGSGKSFLLQELVQSMLALDTAVFVLDIGASYKNICALQKGEMVRFNHQTNISLNPFATLSNSGARYAKARALLKKGYPIAEVVTITGLTLEKIEALNLGMRSGKDPMKEMDSIEIIEIKSADKKKLHFVSKDSIIYAKSMLASMCCVTGQARGEALIEKAIIKGVTIHGNDLDITDLIKVLAGLEDDHGNIIDEAASMADSLYPYSSEGIHGRFFKKGGEASFKKMLTVFEFEELQNDKPLLGVVLQVILMQITMQFLCGDRSRKFMLVVDEAWMILDFAASFLERFARTVRKYGGSLVVCTQDLGSFDNTCGTRKAQNAILESSTWKLILQQNSDGLKTFGANENYRKILPLIESIRKCSSNKFSEVMIRTDGTTVVGRLACDAFSTSIFSTESEDFKFLREKEKEGMKMEDAVLELSKKYGGVPPLEEEKEEPKKLECYQYVDDKMRENSFKPHQIREEQRDLQQTTREE